MPEGVGLIYKELGVRFIDAGGAEESISRWKENKDMPS